MEDISFYFQPISVEGNPTSLMAQENIHDENGFPELKTNSVAFFYVPEFRNSSVKAEGKVQFREELYRLNAFSTWSKGIFER